MGIVSSAITVKSFPIHFQIERRYVLWRYSIRQRLPHVHDARSARWQHGVLEAVEIFAVDGRNEFARC